jgi:hypothetical protein
MQVRWLLRVRWRKRIARIGGGSTAAARLRRRQAARPVLLALLGDLLLGGRRSGCTDIEGALACGSGHLRAEGRVLAASAGGGCARSRAVGDRIDRILPQPRQRPERGMRSLQARPAPQERPAARAGAWRS